MSVCRCTCLKHIGAGQSVESFNFRPRVGSTFELFNLFLENITDDLTSANQILDKSMVLGLF